MPMWNTTTDTTPFYEYSSMCMFLVDHAYKRIEHDGTDDGDGRGTLAKMSPLKKTLLSKLTIELVSNGVYDGVR